MQRSTATTRTWTATRGALLWPLALLLLPLLPSLPAGCSKLTCGNGTVELGGVCEAAPIAKCGDGTVLQPGGICVGDPNKYPHCDPATTVEKHSDAGLILCVGIGGGKDGGITPDAGREDAASADAARPGDGRPRDGAAGDGATPPDAVRVDATRPDAARPDAPLPPNCPPPPGPSSPICITGRALRLESFAPLGTDSGAVAKLYDPLAFLTDPLTPPLQVQPILAGGYFRFTDVTVPFGNLLAVVIDDAGTAKTWAQAAIGFYAYPGKNVEGTTALAISTALQDGWSKQASLPAGTTFETQGSYILIFMLADKSRVAGVRPLRNYQPVPANLTSYFRDATTLELGASATGPSGMVMVSPAGKDLMRYSGDGGGQTWSFHEGAAPAGVLFLQFFLPEGP